MLDSEPLAAPSRSPGPSTGTPTPLTNRTPMQGRSHRVVNTKMPHFLGSERKPAATPPPGQGLGAARRADQPPPYTSIRRPLTPQHTPTGLPGSLTSQHQLPGLEQGVLETMQFVAPPVDVTVQEPVAPRVVIRPDAWSSHLAKIKELSRATQLPASSEPQGATAPAPAPAAAGQGADTLMRTPGPLRPGPLLGGGGGGKDDGLRTQPAVQTPCTAALRKQVSEAHIWPSAATTTTASRPSNPDPERSRSLAWQLQRLRQLQQEGTQLVGRQE